MERGEDLVEDGPESVWPPRPDDVPEPRFADVDSVELRLDHDAAVPESHEFTPSKLTDRERALISEPKATAAVAFDPKNPSGRTGYDAIFDANDDDFRRRRNALRRQSALAGAFVFLVCLAAFQPFALLPFFVASLAGAAAGVTAELLGDRSETWLFAALAGGLLMAPIVDGMIYLIYLGAIGGGGWLTGFCREVR